MRVFIYGLALLLAAICGSAAAVSSSFKILGPSGAVLETITQGNGEVKRIDLRSSTDMEVSFELDDSSATHASLIVQGRAGDDKNVVMFASLSGGRAKATFGWDLWTRRYGVIEDGAEFDVSIAVWGSDESSAQQTEVAVLAFVHGPQAPPTPGKAPLAKRITEAFASMSRKPEIVHMFRPEEKMIPALVSYACALVVFAPVVGALVLMSKIGVNSAPSSNGKLLRTAFYGGVVAIIGVEVAFWLGSFNLLEAFPVLFALELCVMASGIRLAKRKVKKL